MSETLAGSTRRSSKTTCRKCNRTVYVVMAVSAEGPVAVETDPELIAVILFEQKTPRVDQARRLHSDLCETYQELQKKASILAERKAWDAKQRRIKRPAIVRRDTEQ